MSDDSAFIWWENLKQPERNLLVKLLFKMDLTEYVETENGDYARIKEGI